MIRKKLTLFAATVLSIGVLIVSGCTSGDLTVDVQTKTGTLSLSWKAPTTYTDGQPLTVAGYKIYYGTASRSYSGAVNLGSPATNYTVTLYNIPIDSSVKYYFAVTAYDASGNESAYSSELVKSVADL